MMEITDPRTKIFFIGFNRTATVSIHHLMRKSGIRSVHWTEDGGPTSPNVAVEIDKRLSNGQALRAYLSRWTAFSDLSGGMPGQALTDGNRHFRRFHELFPTSFFILNDRDTDAWIRSRIALEGGRYVVDHARRLDVAEAEIPAIWRGQKERHAADVLDFFRDSERFLHFRIDADPPAALTTFLHPRFRVPAGKWRHLNKSAP